MLGMFAEFETKLRRGSRLGPNPHLRPSRITPLPGQPRLIERVRHNNLFVWNGLRMAMLAAVVLYGLLASSN
jgi:hypothetical protein